MWVKLIQWNGTKELCLELNYDVEECTPAPPASAQEGRVRSDHSALTAHRKRQLNVVVW